MPKATITLPWCETDEGEYASLLENAIDSSDGTFDDIMSMDRIVLTIEIHPAVHSACTLAEAVETAMEAIHNRYTGMTLIEVHGLIANPSHRPHIRISVAEA
jgi:hypothetical protein